jgi:hypothetical protein
VEQFDSKGERVLRCTLVDGMPDGLFEQVDPDSGSRLQARFRQGQMEGPMTLHDARGALVQSCTYRAGRLHGTMKTFEQGRCSARLHHVAGELEGPAEYFHEGRCVRRSHYHQDRLEGESIDFSAAGEVVQTCTYSADLLHGPLRRFWPDGTLMEEIVYEQGVPVGAPVRRDADGRDQDTAQRPSLGDRLQRLVRGG